MIHVLEEFEGEQNVEVMTADDFLTRSYQIGLKELNQLHMACVIRVLGKPELNNAIRLNELEIVMSSFLQQPEEEPQKNQGKKDKKNEMVA